MLGGRRLLKLSRPVEAFLHDYPGLRRDRLPCPAARPSEGGTPQRICSLFEFDAPGATGHRGHRVCTDLMGNPSQSCAARRYRDTKEPLVTSAGTSGSRGCIPTQCSSAGWRVLATTPMTEPSSATMGNPAICLTISDCPVSGARSRSHRHTARRKLRARGGGRNSSWPCRSHRRYAATGAWPSSADHSTV
jgi:hypothetical protein